MSNTIATNITRARQSRGLTMEELASLVGCSKQAISHYENGIRIPDSSTLLAIAAALKKDLDYFYSNVEVAFSLHAVNYREGLQLNTQYRQEIEELASIQISEYLELETIAKETVGFTNPLLDLSISTPVDAEKAAKQLRKKWRLGEGAISNVADLLEKKGVRIIKIDFGFKYTHEGLSGWAENGQVPVIVLHARQQDVCRVRFTMLHELGHLLLMMPGDLDIATIERICDAFAGAVLLPADILLQEFGRNRTVISMPELRRIKELYGVSVAAIMVRARQTNLITFEGYQKWKAGDYADRDAGQYSGVEEPRKFLQMLYRCLSEQKIGFDKAAQLSNWNETELRQVYYQQL